MAKIANPKWIPEEHARKLRSVGIFNPQDLLNICKDPENLQQVAQQTGIRLRTIKKWCKNASIYRISGVGTRYAGLLNATGVDSVIKLAQSTPQSLHQQMADRNSALNLVQKLPSRTLVGKWVVQARNLAGDIGKDEPL
jgi:predicted flap endonuclease-1-like 5' DNA nuclease